MVTAAAAVIACFCFANAVRRTSAIELQLSKYELNLLNDELVRFSDNQVSCNPVGGARNACIGRKGQLNGVSVATGQVA
jgi:hypothetical protein